MKLLLCLVVGLLSTTTPACVSSPAVGGGSTLRAHSVAAQTLDDIAKQARDLVMAQRQQVIDSAVAAAKAAQVGAYELSQSVRKAAADFDATPKISSVNAFIAAKDLYVRAVLVAAGNDKPTWEQAKAMLNDVVKTYTAMRQALGTPAAMPELPAAIVDLLSAARTPYVEAA